MFSFGSRVNGITYYFRLVTTLVVGLLLGAIATLTPDRYIAVIIILLLVVVLYMLCLTRQRANDIGWHPLIVTVLVFWTPLLLVIGLLPSQSSNNKYGPAPLKGLCWS